MALGDLDQPKVRVSKCSDWAGFTAMSSSGLMATIAINDFILRFPVGACKLAKVSCQIIANSDRAVIVLAKPDASAHGHAF